MDISVSRINTYLSCRRKYELSYIHKLKPLKEPKALEYGKDYHSRIEALLKGESFEHTPETIAFARMSGYEGWNVTAIEEEFKETSGDHTLHGFIDVVLDDCIVDHKTTSSAIDEKFISKLRLDRQFMVYCYIKGFTKAKIAVVKKCALKQRATETDEEYFQRKCDWYDSDEKFRIITLTYTREELIDCMRDIDDMAREMSMCSFYPRNPSACKIMGCPFEEICMNKDIKDVVGFVKKPEKNKILF